MAGYLQFTLGLETEDFLRKTGISSAAIMGLASVGEALHKVMEKVFQSFEQGAALEHLSKRTGESAGRLYQLQEAMKACGASAEGLPTMLFQMQKALGGVSEMGESTADVFHKLHLSIGDLKNAGPAEALAHIMERLSKLSPDSAAKASSMIFGRMGAGQAVQMSRSPNEFREAFADAAPQANIFERAGAAFAKIQRTIDAIKRELTGFWAGIAEGAAPAVQSILNWLRKIDLTGLGQRIGAMLGIITESFGDGTFSTVLQLAFQVAFEKAEFYGQKFVSVLAATIMAIFPKAIEASFEIAKMAGRGLSGWMQHQTRDIFAEDVARLEALKAKGVGRGGGKWNAGDEEALATKRGALSDADALSKDLDAQKKAANAESIRRISADFATALPEALAAAKAAWKNVPAGPPSDAENQLSALYAKFRARIAAVKVNPAAGGTDDVDFGKGLTHRTEGNVFEKMGFAMGGGGGPINEVARNTARTVDILDQISNAVCNRNNNYSDNAVIDQVHQPL